MLRDFGLGGGGGGEKFFSLAWGVLSAFAHFGHVSKNYQAMNSLSVRDAIVQMSRMSLELNILVKVLSGSRFIYFWEKYICVIDQA